MKLPYPMEIKPMLELTRIDFGNLSSKIMKVKCENNEEMGAIKLEALTDLLEIDQMLSDKIKNGATNVDRLKDKINTLNDATTQNINHLLKLNETLSNSNFCLLYTSPSPRDLLKSRMPSSA